MRSNIITLHGHLWNNNEVVCNKPSEKINCKSRARETKRECALYNYSDRWRLRSRFPVR